MTPIKLPKKLIEVALPLDDINIACGREKSIRHGHPSTLHLWWARRPLAAARAVIFAQMVNDPGYERELGRGMNKHDAQIERERLFEIIRKLVLWENTNNEAVLEEARAEIWKSWKETCELNKNHPQAAELFNPEKLPAFHDPFAGGGSLPLEAQRLGLESYASDLNPVAVLINKAMIEIPPKFAGRAPVGPLPDNQKQLNTHEDWSGAKGLAEDVRRYGEWIKNRAIEILGEQYQEVKLGNEKAKVLTWFWCRTVASPNPAANGQHVPLIKSFKISSRNNLYVFPHVSDNGLDYNFVLQNEIPTLKGTISGKGGICILTNTAISLKYIRNEGVEGRISHRLMAITVETKNGKAFLAASEIKEPDILNIALPLDIPDSEILHWAGCTNVVVYGMTTFKSLFNNRQQLALFTFCKLVTEVRNIIKNDAITAGMINDGITLSDGGTGSDAYADAILTYLTCAIGRAADYWNTLTSWEPDGEFAAHAFTKHALPIVWDYCEINPLIDKGGSWSSALGWVVRVIEKLPFKSKGYSLQIDAAKSNMDLESLVVYTDPPYYDNVPYANLSDFFYIWMRQCLRDIFPETFATKQTPKNDEIVASHSLYKTMDDAMNHFTTSMTKALSCIHKEVHPSFPITIYYAFKQSDTKIDTTSSSGWESFLASVVASNFVITGTWPMRTERATRGRAIGSNALASSIVLVCRKRDEDAPTISRRQFLRDLKQEMTDAMEVMIGGAEGISPVAPVDLAQAIIGPGMAIYSKYSAVLEADGSAMNVHTALTLINKILIEGDDDFDADTLFSLGWFDEVGWSEGEFGQANVLAQAKGTSVQKVRDAGVVESSAGRVRLLKWTEYAKDWSPKNDHDTPIWEALHQLIREFNQNGEIATGALLAKMPSRAEAMRSLAYRLYTLCERKNWAEDARSYNELITAWTSIESASHDAGHVGTQMTLDL